MDLVDALSEADILISEFDLTLRVQEVQQLLQGVCSNWMDNSGLRSKCTKVALKAAKQHVAKQSYNEAKRLIIFGRQLSQTPTEIIDLELCALMVFLGAGDRTLAVEKLKLLNARQAEMTPEQRTILSHERVVILSGAKT